MNLKGWNFFLVNLFTMSIVEWRKGPVYSSQSEYWVKLLSSIIYTGLMKGNGILKFELILC